MLFPIAVDIKRLDCIPCLHGGSWEKGQCRGRSCPRHSHYIRENLVRGVALPRNLIRFMLCVASLVYVVYSLSTTIS
jgi:hypothetical protein